MSERLWWSDDVDASPRVHDEGTPHAGKPVRWDEVGEIRVLDDNGQVLYAGPQYLRCLRQECLLVVTHGMMQRYGACWCGNRRVNVALKVRQAEKAHLKAGYYELTPWEVDLIQPTLPAGKALGWGKEEYDAA